MGLISIVMLGPSIRQRTSIARKKTVVSGTKNNRPKQTEVHSRAVYQSFLDFSEKIPAKVNA